MSPVLAGLSIIWYLKKYHNFEFTNFLFTLLLIHAIVLMIGGHWAYVQVPFFNWLKDIGIFQRNNYDKVGHFMQGFVPVLIAREVILRKTTLTGMSLGKFSFGLRGAGCQLGI